VLFCILMLVLLVCSLLLEAFGPLSEQANERNGKRFLIVNIIDVFITCYSLLESLLIVV
jgi:hypothetical protein